MTANPNSPTNPPIFSEAPASWNVRYHLNGFDCQLTLRGETGGDVLTRAEAALKWLAEHGAAPASQVLPVNMATGAPAKTPTLANGAPDPAWCELHQVAMQRRERNGEVWYSHKNGDTYCKGK